MGCCFAPCFVVVDFLVGTRDDDYEPKTEADYHHILRFKGAQLVYAKPDGSDYSVGQLQYRKDLVAGKVIYRDEPKFDAWQYVRNQHSLIGMRGSSRMHPYSRRERFVVVSSAFVLAVSLALFWEALVVSGKEDAEDEGESYNEGTQRFIMNTFGSILCVLNSQVSSNLAKCSCAQGEGCASCLTCCECLANATLTLWLIGYVGFWLLMGSVTAGSYGVDAVEVILASLYSLVISWFVWEPLTLAFFFWRGSNAEQNEDQENELKLKNGQDVEYNHSVPFRWYLEWKEAGFPKFPEDDPVARAEADKRGLKISSKKTDDGTGPVIIASVTALHSAASQQSVRTAGTTAVELGTAIEAGAEAEDAQAEPAEEEAEAGVEMTVVPIEEE